MTTNLTGWEPFGEFNCWDPFRDFASLADQFDRLFGDSLLRFPRFPSELAASAWLPAVDVTETDNDIVLRADLPGVDPKEVDIQVENDTLTLRGERRQEKDIKGDGYRRMERSHGTFLRSFTLPNTVDAEKIQAEYRNGVLELTLPKRAEAKPKQIKVSVKS